MLNDTHTNTAMHIYDAFYCEVRQTRRDRKKTSLQNGVMKMSQIGITGKLGQLNRQIDEKCSLLVLRVDYSPLVKSKSDILCVISRKNSK